MRKLIAAATILVLVATIIGTAAVVVAARNCDATPFSFDDERLRINKPTILHVRWESPKGFRHPVGITKTVKVPFTKPGYTVLDGHGSGWRYPKGCAWVVRQQIKNGKLPLVSPGRLIESFQAVRRW